MQSALQVEIHKEVTAIVKVLDAYGHALLPNFFTLMGLTLRAASDIVSVRWVILSTEFCHCWSGRSTQIDFVT